MLYNYFVILVDESGITFCTPKGKPRSENRRYGNHSNNSKNYYYSK